ncbi:MAG TPA: phosphatase PAP2 family protein [Ensifer sp.]|nr:phosphatase PAP2 family protein [Ensifer sp.]
MLQSLVCFIAAFWLVVLAILPFTIITIDASAWTTALLPGVLTTTVLATYCQARGYSRISAPALAFLFNILLLFPIAAFAYAAMQLSIPFVDAQLASIDAAMGFDWNATIAFIDDWPPLAHLLNGAYLAFAPQLIIFPPLLALRNDPSRAYKMLMSYGAISFLSFFISSAVPALGTFGAAGIDFAKNIDLEHALNFVPQLQALKYSHAFVLTPSRVAGVISFPSVHAAVAILCIWAIWPLKLFRYPVLALNVLMAISAIPNGGHYLVDVLAGFAVAVWTILAIESLSARLEARSESRSGRTILSEATAGNS